MCSVHSLVYSIAMAPVGAIAMVYSIVDYSCVAKLHIFYNDTMLNMKIYETVPILSSSSVKSARCGQE